MNEINKCIEVKEAGKCPNCKQNCFQKIIYDFGYSLNLRCSNCGYYWEMIDFESIPNAEKKYQRLLEKNEKLIEENKQLKNLLKFYMDIYDEYMDFRFPEDKNEAE